MLNTIYNICKKSFCRKQVLIFLTCFIALTHITPISFAASKKEPKVLADVEVDNYEKFNRKIFKLNIILDKMFLRPTLVLYGTVIPNWGKEGIYNFVVNMRQPLNCLNYVLQRDKVNAKKAFWRFVINLSIGGLGTLDMASKLTDKLNVADQDFGLTAAHYGISAGTYIMLPLFGPSNIRDTTGFVAGLLLDPLAIVLSTMDIIKIKTLAFVEARYTNREFIKTIEDTSFDSYITLRALYNQKRIGRPKGDKPLPNYDDCYVDPTGEIYE